MDRAEVIAALREAYQTGGMRLLSAIADDIREHGPLHDPEFVTCIQCGNEFEPVTGTERQNGGRQKLRLCFGCQPVEQIERHRRWLRERRATKKETP